MSDGAHKVEHTVTHRGGGSKWDGPLFFFFSAAFLGFVIAGLIWIRLTKPSVVDIYNGVTNVIERFVPDTGDVDPEEARALAEQEYYRGLYDFCVATGTNYFGIPESEAVKGCNKAVQSALKNDWYGQPSPGFEYGK